MVFEAPGHVHVWALGRIWQSFVRCLLVPSLTVDTVHASVFGGFGLDISSSPWCA